MKHNLVKWTLSLAILWLAANWLQAADAPLRFSSAFPCSVTIDGTSTIHPWTVEGRLIAGFFEVDPALLTAKTLQGTPKVEVTIPVRSLHNKEGYQKMDEIMQEAMRESDNKRINYRMTQMAVKGTVPDSGSPIKFDTKGELTVAGVTNKIDMEVTMETMPNDRIKFSGTKVVKMTDFKITPPAPKIAMGLIKTGDEVTVKFQWLVKKDVPKDAAAPAKAPEKEPSKP